MATRLLRRDLGGARRVSNGGGSHGNTRRAASGDLAVVVKLGQPAGALRRLSEPEVPPARWARFAAILGATLDDDLTNRVLWWAGFKALRNGYWVDAHGDADLAEMNVRGLLWAMARPRPA